MEIALGYRSSRCLQSAQSFGRLWFPNSPPGNVLLEEDSRPNVVPVAQKQSAVQLVEVGNRLHRGQSGPGHGKQAMDQGLPLSHQCGRLVRCAVVERGFGIAGEGRHSIHCLAVPSFGDGVGLGMDGAGRGRGAGSEQRGQDQERAHSL